ncbi:GNAT family N-acetyltransferase [Bacillus sp. FJAT-29814]|uniref:GNAT family N-acetyltransferase n=1 Tax=Bacillus sp. FJAT-29814 TaxID=1729688 RepID=UPI0008378C2E|nr:GNAT family N-acetyltransferase [Bacillus sp. FJAT-29814]
MDIKKVKFKITDEEGFAFLDDIKVAEFEFYEDSNGRKWINNIAVKKEYQKRGIGTEMIRLAVEEFGEVYASTASKMDGKDNDYDTRHLSTEGAALVNSSIRKGILKKEWVFNPYFIYEDDDFEEGDDPEYWEYLRQQWEEKKEDE